MMEKNDQVENGIPDDVWEKLKKIYQSPSNPSTPCPDPVIVIGYAMRELVEEERLGVYEHLLECTNCLNLVIDVRGAAADAAEEDEGGQ